MRIGGITRRWFLNTFSVVLAVLIVVAVLVVTTVHGHYYDSVAQLLRSTAGDVPAAFLNLYSGDSSQSLLLAGTQFIEKFAEKDKICVWIIDRNGRVILSSNGFAHDTAYDMPDYTQALSQKDAPLRQLEVVLPSGEKAMASTVVLRQPDGAVIGAVRFLISLEDIDRQEGILTGIVVLSCLFAVLLLLFSGFLFIKSIVGPIRKISETAQRIADGDLNARIDHYHYGYDDELGSLCETINNMAQELETSDRLKNDFISTVSHELRTPLTAIKGWGETLLQVRDTDEVATKRGMNIIISESTRLAGIVEELLDFSRMQSGRLKMKSERIDLLAELDEIVFTMKERALREGIEIIYTVPQYPVPMMGDSDRIRQVFVNVLDNAIKYNEPGGRIAVTAEAQGEMQLEISVSDTGRGIASEDLQYVKEKFFKADNTVRGSGIGLAVADEIVKHHGGNLTIDSILGEGTTVSIQLPTDKIVIPEDLLPEERDLWNEQEKQEE